MKFFRRMRAQIKLAWELLTSYISMVRGIWKIEKLAPPRITVFGGAKVASDSLYARQAHELARLLIARGFSVITGGGPGIMEAANCGAYNKNDAKTHSIGIPVAGINKEMVNHCADTIIPTTQFFIRKWLLTRSTHAFAVFPGGFGTLDEMTEILTLMQTNKLQRLPIVLIDKAYWQHFLNWVEHATDGGMIAKEDSLLLRVTDDINQACDWLSLCSDTIECSN